MNYKQAREFIDSAYRLGSKLGLDNITELMNRLGNPQNDYKIIHVAGTNGKGSTCAMIYSVLQEAGYKTGLFTSPHLTEFRERMQINNCYITEETLASVTSEVKQCIDTIVADGFEHPTGYEVVVAIGFLFFKQQKVDVAVVEVGLGGELDATNIVNPILSVITPISIDHTKYLGATLKEIATAKAGIIKQEIPVVISTQEPDVYDTLKQIAKQRYSKVYVSNNIKQCSVRKENALQKVTFQNEIGEGVSFSMSLLGEHQIDNAKTALCTLQTLRKISFKINNEAIINGFSKAKWPGRFEVVNLNNGVVVIMDGAHNLAGAIALKQTISQYFSTHYTLLTGMLKDKDIKGVLGNLTENAESVIITEPSFKQRAATTAEVAVHVAAIKQTIQESNLDKALEKSIDVAMKTQTPLVIAGSLFLIGDLRERVLAYCN